MIHIYVKHSSLLAFITFLFGCTIHAQEETFFQVPGVMAKEISYAYEDFHSSSKDFGCFNMILDAQKDIHYVTFLWVVEAPPEGMVVIGGENKASKCGKELSYEFDANTGIFLRKVYQK